MAQLRLPSPNELSQDGRNALQRMKNYVDELFAGPVGGFRNHVINGDFRINQRSFASTTTNATFGHDRWWMACGGGTVTYSSQPTTVGSDPIVGHGSTSFARLVTASQSAAADHAALRQSIENMLTLEGQQVAVSFWARAGSGAPKVAVEFTRMLASGGAVLDNVHIGTVVLDTTWRRYTVTGRLPSAAGSTPGATSCLRLSLFVSAGSNFDARLQTLGHQNNTFDFWGVQVERGSRATTFEQRPLALELAMCERYYERFGWTAANTNEIIGAGIATSTSTAQIWIPFRQPMQRVPTLIPGTVTNWLMWWGTASTQVTAMSLDANLSSTVSAGLAITTGAFMTSNQFVRMARFTNQAFIAFEAELL